MGDWQKSLANRPSETQALLEAAPSAEADAVTVFPLSFAQQRLWFLDQLEAGLPLYNLPVAVRLKGDLNVPVLERSLDALRRRHETLRTTFGMVDGRAVQKILPAAGQPLPRVDLRNVPARAREALAHRLASDEARRLFDIEREPLFRACLLCFDDADHLLLLVLHHLVADGQSIDILRTELAALYAAFAQNQPSPLAALPVQYADYAFWQRAAWQAGSFAESLDFWRRRLDETPILELATARPRPSVRRGLGTQLTFQLRPGLKAALEALSHGERATLFMTLLAAFSVLLYRCTGQTDFAIGSPIDNRSRPELNGLLGLFVNTLALRTRIAPELTFRQFLRQVREGCLEAYTHHELPFEKIVEELRFERTPSHTPLFQVMFALQNPFPSAELNGITFQPVPLDSGTSKCDLTLFLSVQGNDLAGAWEYDVDLFEPAQVEQLTQSFAALVEGIAARPDTRLYELPLLTGLRRQQVLSRWTATETPFPRQACVHTLFEAQARQTPDAVAVVMGGAEGQPLHQLSYAEVDRRSDRLAGSLRALGIGPGGLVGLCVERSPEMVVAILAILKAGGAYVPLDPTYPRERLAFMLEDTRAPVVLTQERLLPVLPECGDAVHVRCLDRDWGPAASTGALPPSSPPPPDSPAYVMYTSGSTGRPKAIVIPHRAISRLVVNTDYVSLTAADRVAQASNLSFDAATFEIWGALLHGGALVIMTKTVTLSPPEFAAQLREQRISTLFLTTALFNQVARESPTAFNALQHLLFGGEAVEPALVRRVLELGPPARLLHVYGPTESTTFATWYRVQAVPEAATTVPIGGPLANTHLYVLDRHLQIVPPGVPGELYIGGEGLAHGYLDRPDLTAGRFVPSPFSERGDRLYKTGDLVRWRPEGALEFIGRNDEQIKLRGFRIEPGEIEAALVQHPAVHQALVVAQREGPDQAPRPAASVTRLIAYVTSRDGLRPTPGDVRRFVAQALPEYMVPSAVVVLERWPLTPNGKVNRRALPHPEIAPAGDGAALVPQTPVEEIVAGIWAEILDVSRVGRDDNFFDLGGHSLLATRVVSALRKTLQIEIPLQYLFESPTLAGLARRLESAQAAVAGVRPPIRPGAREGRDALPLSFAQQRLWVLDQLMPGTPLYNIPQAVRLSGRLDVPVLERSLNEIVRRHEVLRTTFQTRLGHPVQVLAPDLALIIPVIDLQTLPDADQTRMANELVAAEARGCFDLEHGPLIRARLLRLAFEEHILVLNMHHIVFDGWSTQILVRELTALYAMGVRGRAPALPDLPIQYADFAVWQRQWLQGEALAGQLAYWKRQLAGLPVLDLPTDYARPSASTYQGAVHRFALSSELTDALQDLSRQAAVTLFMTLVAALALLLHWRTRQTDIVIGASIANRNEADIEGLIGFFVNVLVLRTRLDDPTGQASLSALLDQVRTACLDAYAHQDLPFEKLVEELQAERDWGDTPFFRVMFSLQTVSPPSPDEGGLALSFIEVETYTAKFDLVFNLSTTPDGLQGAIRYRTDLFRRETIASLADLYLTVLQAMTQGLQVTLAELEALLTQASRRQQAIELQALEEARLQKFGHLKHRAGPGGADGRA